MEFLYVADSKEAILAWGNQQNVWGKQQGGYCRIFEYKHGNNHAIVLLEDVGSGVYRDNIYIFGKSEVMKEWRFVLYRPTSVEVKVCQEDSKLIFKNESTDTKDVILDQSFDALGPFGKSEPVESITVEFPFLTDSKEMLGKETILAWSKQRSNCRVFEYSHNDNHAIVLLMDEELDVYRNKIYIFGEKMKGWDLKLFRLADTEVKVHQDAGKLLFKTTTGDVLLEQSFDALWPRRALVEEVPVELK